MKASSWYLVLTVHRMEIPNATLAVAFRPINMDPFVTLPTPPLFHDHRGGEGVMNNLRRELLWIPVSLTIP